MTLALEKWHGRRGHFEIVLEVMRSLRQRDLSLTHILAATYLNSQVLTPILEDLEKRGFITHTTTTHASRPSHLYHLTRAGWELTEHYLVLQIALQ